MIPIPDYLKSYGIELLQKGDSLSFKLKCDCGCELFSVLKRSYSNEEKRLIQEYENNLPKLGMHTIYGEIDRDGNPIHYIKVLGLFKKKIIFPQAPSFMNIAAVKGVCSSCKKIIDIFDSRYHGYDGMLSVDRELQNYVPTFTPSKKSYEIVIVIENDPSLEAFNENSNERYSYEFYSNAFYSIRVYGIDENGRKRMLFDAETA